MRILDYLTERQVAFEAMPHPPAYTAQQRAKYLGLSGRQVAKGVLLRGPQGFLVAILPATQQIDFACLELALGGPVRLARDDEMAAVFSDCEWGVVPPFGSLYGVPTVLEAGIAPDTVLVFEAQTSVDSLRIRCDDYERLEKPTRLGFARVQSSQPRCANASRRR